MIRNQDRSGWFGASDTIRVMSTWKGKTFTKWWAVKLGVMSNTFSSSAMRAGTNYERRILEYMGIRQMDRQIRIRPLRLRVNLDGEDRALIHEVKTYGKEFTVTKAYWMQCQVEAFAAKKPCIIDAYKLNEDDYSNYFNPIDGERLSHHPIEYDRTWIEGAYLPRLEVLAWCLKHRRTPNEALCPASKI